jgi:radical S-adenosyl methionine domain-containing protein 2
MNLPKGHQSKAETLHMLHLLAEHGVRKITFAGGEPMLCPWLLDLIIEAKSIGLVTSIITNGSRLTAEWLQLFAGVLDWLGVSIDSLNPEVLIKSGRAVSGKSILPFAALTDLMLHAKKSFNIKLKVNTVVHSLNWQEDLSTLLSNIKPDRWKVLQVLPMMGQNDGCDDLLITETEFNSFIQRHKQFNPIAESNELMRSSYMLIDPAGRFFNDANGFHSYSNPIAEIGIEEAFAQVNVNRETFLQRGGVYNW